MISFSNPVILIRNLQPKDKIVQTNFFLNKITVTPQGMTVIVDTTYK